MAIFRIWWKGRRIRRQIIDGGLDSILVTPYNDDMQDIISHICKQNPQVHLNRLASDRINSPSVKVEKWLRKICKKKSFTALSVGYRDISSLGFPISNIAQNVSYCEIGLISNQFPNSTKPYISYLLDKKAPYFDGRRSTELEDALNSLKPDWWKNDPSCQSFLLEYKTRKITKYKVLPNNSAATISSNDLLIIGQCTGDQSLIYTTGLAKNNIELIELILQEYIGAFDNIYYRPHPLNPKNSEEIAIIKNKFGNIIKIDVSNQSLLKAIANKPTIATMTSGVGLEAAVHGCEVITYCTSFYSNWGFTLDKTPCKRRNNCLSAEDLFLHVYMKYSTYLHPFTNGSISPLQALRGNLNSD